MLLIFLLEGHRVSVVSSPGILLDDMDPADIKVRFTLRIDLTSRIYFQFCAEWGKLLNGVVVYCSV